MRFLSRKKGVITTFVAVITPVIILLVLVLSDIYLARNALAAAKNALKASCGCVLSQFSTYMKDEYSLYGYEMSDAEAFYIINESLKESCIGNGLYKMAIEDMQIIRTKPLSDYPVAMEQINTLMEDEIFKQIIEQTNERIKVFSKIKDATRILNIKMQIDELIGGLKNAHTSLKQTVEEINSSQYYYDLMEIVRVVDALYNDMLICLNSDNQNEIDSSSIIKKQIMDIIKINIDNIVYVLKEYNYKAVNLLQEMINTYADIHILSKSLMRAADGIKDCPVYLSEVVKLCTDAVYEMEDAFSLSVLEQLKNVLDRNADCLDTAVKYMIDAVNESQEVSLYEVFSNGFSVYCDAIYDPDFLDSFLISVIDDTFNDERFTLKKIAEELLNSIIINDMEIDSFITLLSESYDDTYLFNVDTTKNTSRSIFSSFNDLSDILSHLKEDIFLNEYIMLYMNSFNDSKTITGKNRYLDSEVEYIIFGNRDNEKNIKSCKAFIMAVRFACNAIHVYTDLPKRSKAEAIGACLAGSWSFGVATPIAKNLVLCSWALSESAYDTDILLKGGNCPIIKMSGDWQLKIDIGKGVSKTPEWLKIDYEDYLRILLCTKNNKDKVLRILDLISLNSPNSIDMSAVSCGIKICANLKYKGFLGVERNFYVEAEDSY